MDNQEFSFFNEINGGQNVSVAEVDFNSLQETASEVEQFECSLNRMVQAARNAGV